MSTYRQHVEEKARELASGLANGTEGDHPSPRDRCDPNVRALVTTEWARIVADPSYTPVERLRLAAAFALLRSNRPTAITKGLETYERVEAAHPGSQVHQRSPESEALAVAERRLAEMRQEQ